MRASLFLSRGRKVLLLPRKMFCVVQATGQMITNWPWPLVVVVVAVVVVVVVVVGVDSPSATKRRMPACAWTGVVPTTQNSPLSLSVRFYRSAGADINATNNFNGGTPLHCAANENER